MAESNDSSLNYQENYSVSAFIDYLGTKLCWSSSGRKHHHFRWLFWSPEHDESEDLQTILFSNIPATLSDDHLWNIKEKIKYAIQHIIESYIDYCLVQFWAPETRGGRHFLTTAGQPFAVDWLCKGLCWYRKHCLSHDYLVDVEANEAESGPPGRVFRTGLPESSPDSRLYSTKEYPLRNQSLSCGIRAYMALPVYEMVGTQCVGVLEFVVFSAGYINIINEVAEGLKAADLRWTRVRINPPNALAGHSQNENDHERGKQQVLKEIEDMFEEMKRTPQLYLAQAWITSKQYSDDTAKFGTIFLEQARHKVFVEDEEQYNSSTTHFLKATKLHGLILGSGIVGTLLSTYKSFFCPSICNFSITEFPLVHYARLARLTATFSVCLQCILTGDDVYVLEFFLLPGQCSLSFLPLLMTIIQQFGNFRLLSGQLVGEGLSVKAIEFGKNYDYDDVDQSNPYPLRIEILHYGDHELEKLRIRFHQLHFGSDHVMEFNTVASSVEQSGINMSEKNSNKAITRASKREREKQKFHICYEDLQPYFGKTLRDAEIGLGVSRSTLKRACRDHNITRWPSNERNKVNTLLFQKKGFHGCQEKNSMVEDLDFMIVEANFEDDIIKFKLTFPSRMENLEEEVGRRLKLNVTSFRMKYMDEDGKWILLTCDEDLEYCIETLVSSGNNLVKMLVQL